LKLPRPDHEDTPDSKILPGTRSVERTLTLLKELSNRGEFGWRLSDLAGQVGLDRGTCHRMLACLVKEGFAQRHAHDVKYYPGQMLFEMGLALPTYSMFRELVEPRLERIGKTTHCIASFSLRSGHDVVCVFQKRCGVEIAGMMIRVGTRRPLFSAVGGLAILQQLPPAEAARIVEENTQREIQRRGPRRLEDLERMRRRSEKAGFGFTVGDLAPGIAAMAVAVHDTAGQPFAALTLTGADTTITEATLAGTHALLESVTTEIAADAARCFHKPVREPTASAA